MIYFKIERLEHISNIYKDISFVFEENQYLQFFKSPDLQVFLEIWGSLWVRHEWHDYLPGSIELTANWIVNVASSVQVILWGR